MKMSYQGWLIFPSYTVKFSFEKIEIKTETCCHNLFPLFLDCMAITSQKLDSEMVYCIFWGISPSLFHTPQAVWKAVFPDFYASQVSLNCTYLPCFQVRGVTLASGCCGRHSTTGWTWLRSFWQGYSHYVMSFNSWYF